MKDKIGDKARLQHILECITEIRSAISGETEESFIKNHVLRIAVVKWIEIIGEAANHISKETKDSVQNIEWNMIIGLRHIIVHEYFGVNYDAIWNIAVNNVPALTPTIEKLIKDFE
ncbi:MAG: HepT-like ribonuclease domain-containing protein [Bacteroidota bacterium]